MRKSIILILAALFLLSAASAEPDLQAMSTDELTQLRDHVNLELASRSQVGEGVYSAWDSTLAHVELLEMKRGTTDEGLPGVALIFSYTNKGEEIDTFRTQHWIKVYQNGVECDTSIHLDGELMDTGSWGKSVEPGATLKVMPWFFAIPEDTDTIDIELVDRASPSKTAGIFTVVLPD